MRVLALDFDGVVCDSAREVFTAAVHTYGCIDPGSRVVQATLAHRGSAAAELDLSTAPAFADFRELMPLGNRADAVRLQLRSGVYRHHAWRLARLCRVDRREDQ